ncbi:hypothetical protein RRG08_027292 [Elysia crispata]|uniref:Uncharacterized protein n=1 Tax=Elysia crispata TaxID=231223 RepID=A0AAE1E632_9GAST|nr:hypothetical protein RRG08_027292 [Elysia crispata]
MEVIMRKRKAAGLLSENGGTNGVEPHTKAARPLHVETTAKGRLHVILGGETTGNRSKRPSSCDIRWHDHWKQQHEAVFM